MGIKEEYEQQARFHVLTLESNFINTVCRNISAGLTIFELADNLDVHFADLHEYIMSSPSNKKKFEAAELLRGEWLVGTTIRELKRIGTSDIRGLFSKNGGLLNPDEWTDEAAMAVAGIKVKELFDNNGEQIGEMKELKFWDKTRALELIGKNQKMFTEKTEHSLSKSLEDLVAGSMQED